MNITAKEVLHVAGLARLTFSEEEAETFSAQLGAILGYVGQLDELNLEGVEPMAHVHGTVNAFRADEVSPSIDREEALAGAPASEAGCFRVAKIIEGA